MQLATALSLRYVLLTWQHDNVESTFRHVRLKVNLVFGCNWDGLLPTFLLLSRKLLGTNDVSQGS